MFLSKIQLIGFKNYEQAEAVFAQKFNCFTGYNGMGKTNMLDAIYYLSFCKSFYNPADNQNIKKEAPFFMIQGNYQSGEEQLEIYCGLKRNEKKQFKLNKKEYPRLSDHIGLIPLVMIAPEDAELIHGGSEIRRKFIDGVIAQYNKQYLEQLMKYNRVLIQRNALLKSFYERSYFDIAALEIYDEQLSESGNFIFKERKNFFAKFNEIFNRTYIDLTKEKEQVNMLLNTALEETKMEDLLTKSLDKDRQSQYTNVGIHKDDLIFEINQAAVKKFASQGQQKTFLIALKLAQYAFMAQVTNKQPLLLLDDVYDKLDEMRLNSIMQHINNVGFGQIFITDTHQQRMAEVIGSTRKDAAYFAIENGNLKPNRSIF
jgi:DNA replication and repair protein RecF